MNYAEYLQQENKMILMLTMGQIHNKITTIT